MLFGKLSTQGTPHNISYPHREIYFLHTNPQTTHNSSNRSDEGLTLETSAFNSLRWPIHVFNSVVNTKLLAILSQRRSTTVSLETYPFYT